MIFLWIYLAGVVVTTILIAYGCTRDPFIRMGLRKVEIGKVILLTIFWPISWIFAMFAMGKE
jgi:hypothetical protein